MTKSELMFQDLIYYPKDHYIEIENVNMLLKIVDQVILENVLDANCPVRQLKGYYSWESWVKFLCESLVWFNTAGDKSLHSFKDTWVMEQAASPLAEGAIYRALINYKGVMPGLEKIDWFNLFCEHDRIFVRAKENLNKENIVSSGDIKTRLSDSLDADGTIKAEALAPMRMIEIKGATPFDLEQWRQVFEDAKNDPYFKAHLPIQVEKIGSIEKITIQSGEIPPEVEK